MTRGFLEEPAAWRVAGLLAIVVGVLPAPIRGGQSGNRSTPPTLEASSGGFTIRRLNGPVTIDGRTWIAVDPIVDKGTIPAPNGQFTLSLDEPNELGDVVRYRLTFAERGGKPVALTSDPVAYAFMTADSRWIVFDPIDVIDVTTWRRYSLSRVFDIRPYVVPKAISPDGRRMIVLRQDCPFDCPIPPEYYAIGFP